MRLTICLALQLLLMVSISGATNLRDIVPKNEKRFDVAVYGATPGGISAAIAAARMGSRVALIEPTDHIGGIVTNGLTNSDIGKRQAVGGLFYEFTRRVLAYYQAFDESKGSGT